MSQLDRRAVVGTQPSTSDYVDEACAALGGEDSDFIVKGMDPDARPAPYAVGLFCRTCNPDALTCIYSVGEIELWELVADAREHQERQHRATEGVRTI